MGCGGGGVLGRFWSVVTLAPYLLYTHLTTNGGLEDSRPPREDGTKQDL